MHVVIFVSILIVASLFPKLLRSAPFLPVSFSAVMSFICHTLDCTLGFLDMLVDFLVTHTLSSIELHGFLMHKVLPPQCHTEQFNNPSQFPCAAQL